MKKMKKILAVILSLAMVLGMSITAFAAKEGATLEVKGLATYAEQRVDIYEIYRLDANDNGWVAADWTDGTNVTPETLANADMINALRQKALNTNATAANKSAKLADGKYASNVNFTGLQAGAYLVIVTDPTSIE